jgi:hypothetical protein
MPFLPSLAVAFVGIAGPDGAKVTHQVEAVLVDAHVERVSVPGPQMKALVHHAETARDIVRELHVDGVIGGELIVDQTRAHRTLRLFVYDRNGGLSTMSESPLSGRMLSKAELEVLKSNLDDEVETLLAKAPKQQPPEPKPAPTKIAKAAPPPPKAKAPPPPPPAPPPPPPAPVVVTERKVAAPPSNDIGFGRSSSGDDDAPPGMPTSNAHREAAPVQTAAAEQSDSVSAADIEALTGDSGGGVAAQTETAAPSFADELHLGASVGLGFTSRSFTAPTTIAGYSAGAVGTIRFEGHVQPIARLSLSALGERTLQMSSPVFDGTASTSIARWEIDASFALTTGRVRIAPVLGLGRRTFSIDSTDPARTPDSDYNYLVVGANASAELGKRVRLLGVVAFEPVLWGNEPTEMAFGEATRWAFDVGAAVEYRPYKHVFLRAAADYQQFSWSWGMAGNRGGAGATDIYPTGSVSLGASY